MYIFCKILEHHKHLSDGLEYKGRIFFFFGQVNISLPGQKCIGFQNKAKRELMEHRGLQSHHNPGAFPGCAHLGMQF